MKELTEIQADPNSTIHFSYFSKSAAETDFAIFLRANSKSPLVTGSNLVTVLNLACHFLNCFDMLTHIVAEGKTFPLPIFGSLSGFLQIRLRKKREKQVQCAHTWQHSVMSNLKR